MSGVLGWGTPNIGSPERTGDVWGPRPQDPRHNLHRFAQRPPCVLPASSCVLPVSSLRPLCPLVPAVSLRPRCVLAAPSPLPRRALAASTLPRSKPPRAPTPRSPTPGSGYDTCNSQAPCRQLCLSVVEMFARGRARCHVCWPQSHRAQPHRATSE